MNPLLNNPQSETNHSDGEYVSDQITPLLTLLGVAWCEKSRATLRRHLARTPIHDQHLQSLIDLWRSLGCPTDGFWKALLVDYNRIDVCSCDVLANEKMSEGDPNTTK